MSAAVSGNSVPGNSVPPSATTGVTNPTAGGNNGNYFQGVAAGGTGTTAPTNPGSQIIAPGAATSPYEYQYVLGVQGVNLGPEIANMLGLPATGNYSGSQIMQAYAEMSPTELSDLQELLYGAGYYANTAGEPLNQRPVFGSFNIDSFNALSQAIIDANNNPHTSMQQLITDRSQSGAGYYQQQNALTPVLGGGNAYQINLTNPQDVYAVAFQVFESALGRAPTQQEYQNILTSLQGQETKFQTAQNAQQEMTTQEKYQQQVNARTAENTPAASQGAVPNGPFSSASQEALAILQYAYPNNLTASNVQFLAAWIEQNGGVSNNPLAVRDVGGQSTAAQGIQAAVNLLKSPQYQGLDAALASGDASAQANNQAVVKELQQWSGGSISAPLNTGAQATAAHAAIMAVTTTPPTSIGQIPGGEVQGLEKAAELGGQSVQSQLPPPTSTTGPASPNSVAPGQVGGQQGLSAPGDNYLQSSTLTNTEAPSAQNAAWYAATTGANTVPYYANQYLNAFNAIVQMINQGPPKL